MALTRFKIPLNNSVIPVTSFSAQRASVQPGLDAAPRTPRVFMGSEDSADYNMAQVLYAENIMPSVSGIRSVAFMDVLPAGPSKAFDTIFPLRDANENAVPFSPAAGRNYAYNQEANAWAGQSINEVFAPLVLEEFLYPELAKVTYAYVDGKTFVCYSRMLADTGEDMSLMFWDSELQKLVPAGALIENLPFLPGEIDGIASSNGYLLVWSELTIAWAFFNGASFNFEIYANGSYTGSGYQIPEDLQGPITALLSVSGGFVAFTTRNCIGASYHSQTLQSPWVFKEVADAGGIESYEQATVEGSLAKVVAYTSAGIQTLTLNSAEHAHPAVSDFITRRETERYDFTTHQIQRGVVTADLFIKITSVGNRYVVVSYGYAPGIYSYAMVFDVALQRWGKLRIKHRDCFAFPYQQAGAGVSYSALLDVSYDELATTSYDGLGVSAGNITPAQRAMGFLQTDGSVRLAVWSAKVEAGDPDQAVAIIGRIQLSRNKRTQLNRVEVEGQSAGGCFIQTSSNGRTIDYLTTPVIVEASADYRCYGMLADCLNFNVVLEGTFDVSTLIAEATTSGDI